MSLDGGVTRFDPTGVLRGGLDAWLPSRWGAVLRAMDDDVRGRVRGELAPCTVREFLARYLQLAAEPLVLP